MLEAMLERFRQGDRIALARLLSLLARGEHVKEILAALGPPASRSRVVAFTGSAGVGKSTLIGKLIEFLRGRALALLGRLVEAREAMQQVLKRDPGNADAVKAITTIDRAMRG